MVVVSLWIIVMFFSAIWTLILMAPIHTGDPLVRCNAKYFCSDEETNASSRDGE